MRYRLMATYRGVPYEAGIGPTDKDVVLFAACPPPEELGFLPAPGHWRKPVSRAEVDAVWESRPSGMFRGEPCLVIDDLGENVHISYLGDDSYRAEQLGYSQVEPGVFELVTVREDVTGIAEDRIDHAFPGQLEEQPAAGERVAAEGPASGMTAPNPATLIPPQLAPPEAGPAQAGPAQVIQPEHVPPHVFPAPVAQPQIAPPQLAPVPGGRRGRAGARPQRARTRETFAELVDLAAMPQHAYAVDEVVDGAICLVNTESGFEVFSASDGTRQEVRVFDDEEAAYFYLFGLLAAEAVRDGRLIPPG